MLSKLNNRDKLLLLLGVLCILVVSFMREYVFIQINEQLYALWYSLPSTANQSIPFLMSLDYYPLYYSKWVLTLLFALVFLLNASFILHVIFKRYYLRELLAIYVLITVGAASSLAIAWMMGDVQDGYLIARFLMGLAQSPVPLMIMIPAAYLRK